MKTAIHAGSATSTGRVPELDSVRGLAALAVLVAHLFGEPEHGLKALSFGWLGVTVFFALSGYLIGGIILDDLGKPGFFRSFVTRRAARILPIYIVVVTLTLLVVPLLEPANWVPATLHPAAYLTFTQNFSIALGQDAGAWLLPTWTVAVEEQFYLLLPLLVMISPRRHLMAVLSGLCLLSITYRAVVFPLNTEAASMLLPGRADTLLYGVIAACLQRSADLNRHLKLIKYVSLVAGAALVGTLAGGDYGLVVVLSPALAGLATAGLILMIVSRAPDPRQAPSRTLGWFGAISYGLYLVHQPINGLLHGLIFNDRPDTGTVQQLAVTVAAAGASIAVAWLSWRWLEKPILGLSKRPRLAAPQQPRPVT